MKVLVIDGPAMGHIYETSSHRFLAIDSSFDKLGNIEEVTYHVHSYLVANRLIKIASIELLSENISNPNVFELLVSDKAKEAAE